MNVEVPSAYGTPLDKRVISGARREPQMDGYWEGWQSDADGLWYWHLRDANHRIIAHGEGYASKSNCQRGIENVEQTLEATKTYLNLNWIADPNRR